MTDRRKYYPWVVMAACCFYAGAIIGVGTNCNGIFMQPVADALGVGRGDVASYVTVMGIAAALFAPISGRLIGCVDVRKLMTSCACIMALSYFGLSRVTHLWQFCAFGALMGVGVALGSFMVLTVIVNNWFIKRAGTVIGIVFSSSSVVGVFANPLLNRVIRTEGWRFAYEVMAVVMLCTLPVIWALIRMYPSQKNSMAWGEGEGETRESAQEASDAPRPFRELVRSRTFLLLLGMVAISSLVVNHTGHFQGIATTVGFTAEMGALMISAAQAGEFTGKLVIGWLSDRIGVRRAVLTVVSVGGLALLGLLFIHALPAPLALVCAYLYGPMTAVGTVGYSLIVKKLFGNRNYPLVYPYVSITSTVAFSVGFPAIGYVYDLTGSYAPTFLAALAGLALAGLFLTLAMKGQEV